MREIKFRVWRKSYINIYEEELNEFRKTPENQKLRKEMMKDFALAGARQFDTIIKEKFEKTKGIKYEDGIKETYIMDYNPMVYGEETNAEWDMVAINEAMRIPKDTFPCGITADIFLEYTGIKDKNGKEIYEGDILKIYDNSNTPKNEVLFAVEYRDNVGAYYPFYDLFYGIIVENNIFEVIGNIYENPELLEKK